MHKIIACFAVIVACLLTTDSSFGGILGPSERERQLEEEVRMASQKIVALAQKVNYLNKDIEKLNKELSEAQERPLYTTALAYAIVAALATFCLGILLGTRTIKNWRTGHRKEHLDE